MSRMNVREAPSREGVRTNDAPASQDAAGARPSESGQTQRASSAVHPVGAYAPIMDEVALPINEDKIRDLAYFKWQAAGSPESDGVEFWLDAENELHNISQVED